jgi:hypothetical protein
MIGQMYLLTSFLSLVYTQLTSATSYREVAVILGGGSDYVEVYTGKNL